MVSLEDDTLSFVPPDELEWTGADWPFADVSCLDIAAVDYRGDWMSQLVQEGWARRSESDAEGEQSGHLDAGYFLGVAG